MTSLRKFYAAVNDENNLRVVKAAVDNFETNIVPKFDQFTKGIQIFFHFRIKEILSHLITELDLTWI